MRRRGFWVIPLVVLLAACGSSGGKSSTSTVPTTIDPTTVPTTTAPSVSSTSFVPPTTRACAASAGSTAAVTTGQTPVSALLNSVEVASALCVDLVKFGFTMKSDAEPSCRVAYADGPFTADASGREVAVAGSAFVVVRCSPASGYDFESGEPTYTGPARIDTSGTRFVKDLVATGDFEGVLSWVIGLDSERPYRVAVATTPGASPAVFMSALVITFS